MNAYIKRAYDFSTDKKVEVLNYSDLPVYVTDLSASGKAEIEGRLTYYNLSDYLCIGQYIFQISAVSYNRERGTTEVTLINVLNALNVFKRPKPTDDSTMLYKYANVLSYNSFGYYYGSSAPGAANIFQDPVFCRTYFSMVHYDWLIGRTEDSGKLALPFLNSELFPSGMLGFADLYIVLAACDDDEDTQVGYRNQTRYIISWNDAGISVTVNGYSDPGRMKTAPFNLNLNSADNIIISEDYAEGDFYSQVTLYYGNTKYNFARAIDAAGGIWQSTQQNRSTVLESSGATVIPYHPPGYVKRADFGKWAFDTGSGTYSWSKAIKKVVEYWDAADDSIKIVFAAPAGSCYVNQYVNLLMPDGTTIATRIKQVSISSKYPEKEIYTVGGLKTTLTDKLKGVLK